MERLLLASRRYATRLAALVVLGLALALVTGVSPAAPSGTTTSISIAPKAYVYDLGFLLEAQVTILCSGGAGSVFMQVNQTAAQSSNGIGATGSQFFEDAKCDGSPHKLSVTIGAVDGLYDVGTATANAQLAAPSGFADDTRTISIVHV
jgi:hypothetical protein